LFVWLFFGFFGSERRWVVWMVRKGGNANATIGESESANAKEQRTSGVVGFKYKHAL
jgi:hypothetical protein